MNTEIRVWDPSEEHMSYSKPELYNDSISFRFDHFGKEVYNFGDIVIMFWTGAYDRNKKKIFEGDLLRIGKEYAGYSEIPRVVEWDENNFCFGLKNAFYASSPLSAIDLVFAYEVVGNFYENPTLLNEEN